ncbi:hypothetical protein C8F04DRAFT_1228479 [Mycena alexandri]|uniref:Uncharacterized protein n=1 Tax=Mycena alexandri TaxID=1745969 RepID=A0AAD6TGF4_9AGAR|nr:hypothetical protein C8F04DRAFT_1228479 [Mycena alexandri]
MGASCGRRGCRKSVMMPCGRGCLVGASACESCAKRAGWFVSVMPGRLRSTCPYSASSPSRPPHLPLGLLIFFLDPVLKELRNTAILLVLHRNHKVSDRLSDPELYIGVRARRESRASFDAAARESKVSRWIGSSQRR